MKHSARRCDFRADGNLNWVDAAVISRSILILVGAIHLIVLNPEEMRMQFRGDAADQRGLVALRNCRILQLVANHRLVKEALWG